MPLQIIRNDITKVEADVIVNTANPNPRIGSGTDYAIYKAAGKQQLLQEREKIGSILPGEVAITPAFNLHAKYIIHTVGPVWIDGLHNEFRILRNCYENALQLADQQDCTSIAFPLISTGTYGFPKDKALSIATSTITDFLLEHEMEVILVVYDKRAFQLSTKLQKDIVAMIDDQYCDNHNQYEYRMRSTPRRNAPRYESMSARRKTTFETKRRSAFKEPIFQKESVRINDEEYDDVEFEDIPVLNASKLPKLQADHVAFVPSDIDSKADDYVDYEEPMASSLEDFLKLKSEGFTDKLFELIDARQLKDATVYKRANMSKQTFSKIRNNPNYKPAKKSVFQLAISLKLDLNETEDLLSRAGYAFDPSNVGDLIVKYYIMNHSYDIFEINEVLFDQGQDILYGAK